MVEPAGASTPKISWKTLFGGSGPIVKSGDSVRKRRKPDTGFPSIWRKRLDGTMRSARNLEFVRSSASVVPLPSAVELSTLTIGKNRAVPEGILPRRSTSPRKTFGSISDGASVPPRNQTSPDWPVPTSAPGSISG